MEGKESGRLAARGSERLDEAEPEVEEPRDTQPPTLRRSKLGSLALYLT